MTPDQDEVYEAWLAAQEAELDLRASQYPYVDPDTTPTAIEVASWD